MIANTLMHREFTSSYAAKFIIQKEKMYVENANRATREGFITPENLEPNPKNPIIASFFRNVREETSAIYGKTDAKGKKTNAIDEKSSAIYGKTDAKLTKTEYEIVKVIRKNPAVPQNQIAARLGLSNSGVRYSIRGLKEKGILKRSGSNRQGKWILYLRHK